MPSRRFAVIESPSDPHDAMSPAPTRVTVGMAVGEGAGVGPSVVGADGVRVAVAVAVGAADVVVGGDAGVRSRTKTMTIANPMAMPPAIARASVRFTRRKHDRSGPRASDWSRVEIAE